jgi:hypothetical protein
MHSIRPPGLPAVFEDIVGESADGIEVFAAVFWV